MTMMSASARGWERGNAQSTTQRHMCMKVSFEGVTRNSPELVISINKALLLDRKTHDWKMDR